MEDKAEKSTYTVLVLSAVALLLVGILLGAAYISSQKPSLITSIKVVTTTKTIMLPPQIESGFASGVVKDSNQTNDTAEWIGFGYKTTWTAIFDVIFKKAQIIGGLKGPYLYDVVAETALSGPSRPLPVTTTVLATVPTATPAISQVRTSVPTITPEYGKTTVQVKGIDEPDIVKTNGTHMVIIPEDKPVVQIYRVFPIEEAKLVHIVNLTDILSSYIGNETLVVVAANKTMEILGEVKHWLRARGVFFTDDGIILFVAENREPYPLPPRTWVIKLSQKLEIEWVKGFTGSYFDARLYNETIVLVNSLHSASIIPLIYEAVGENISVQLAEDVVIVGYPDEATYIAVLNTENGSHDEFSLLGAPPSTIYMSSTGNLYIALPGSPEDLRGNTNVTSASEIVREIISRKIQIRRSWDSSTIIKMKVVEGNMTPLIEPEAITVIKGRFFKQWQLDEYKGYLRIITQNWEKGRLSVDLYILDSNSLEEVSRLEEIAINEGIHAVRFVEDRLFLVTFRQVDPLFVIDLSNPEKPEILGYLKAPGFDEFFHYIGNDTFIGIGIEEGNVRVTLYKFYENNKTVSPLSRVVLKYYHWSPVLDPRWGHRAFMYDYNHDYILVPVVNMRAPVVIGKYRPEGIWGVAVIHVIDAKKLDFLGILEHEFSTRSTYIGDYIYTIAPRTYAYPMIKIFDAENLEEIARLPELEEIPIEKLITEIEKYKDKVVSIEGTLKGWDYIEHPIYKFNVLRLVISDETGQVDILIQRGPVEVSIGNRYKVIGIARQYEDKIFIEAIHVLELSQS